MSPGRWLLRRALPEDELVAAEELREAGLRRHPRSPLRARLWSWRQTLSLAVRLAFERRAERRASFGAPGGNGSHPRPEGNPMNVVLEETRHALRSLRRRPGFSLLVIVVLAVGIGPAVAIFTVANGLLLRPLPYERPEELALVRIDLSGLTAHPGIAQAEVLDLRRELDVATAVEAIDREQIATLGSGDDMASILAARATPGLFEMLGIRPAVGRWPVTLEDPPRDEAVVSHEFWSSHMGADPARLGESLLVDGDDLVVVGVLPPGFRLLLGPGGGVTPNVDVWESMELNPEARNFWGYRTLVRLAPDVSMEQARSEIAAFGERLVATYPATYDNADIRFDLSPLHEDVVAPARPAVLVLLGAVALVLLIACNNAAGILLAGTLERSREIAVRQTIGAARGRVLLQTLIESLVLAAAAGAVGLGAARVGLEMLLARQPGNLPRVADMVIDLRVAAFAIGASLLACLGFALLPAWHGARVLAGDALRSGGAGSSGLRSGGRNALVVAQVAFSVVLLVGAGLLIRTLDRIGSVELGFEPRQALTMHVPLDGDAFPTAERWSAYDRLLDRLRALPDVEAAGGLQYLPLDGRSFRSSYSPAVDDVDEWNGTTADYRWVTPGALEAMGIRLLAGRDFTAADLHENRPVAIVDASLARELWPGQNAVGQRLRAMVETPFFPDPVVEVIGVMEHPRLIDVRAEVRPWIWLPYTVLPRPDMALVVRTTGPPLAALESIRRTIGDFSTGRPVHTVGTLESLVADASAETRFALLLLTSLSSIALVLAAAGVYSLLAYLVRGRTQETGIRMALGASAGDILRLNLLYGLRLAAIGLVLGLCGALWLGDYLESLLYEVAPRDPITLAGAAVAVLAVAALASWLPARRAAGSEPSAALRSS